MDEISGTDEHNGRPIRLGAPGYLIAAEGEAFAVAIEDRQVTAYRAYITGARMLCHCQHQVVGAHRIARR
jgi:hypothetical protein